jgi:hypothetical protein
VCLSVCVCVCVYTCARAHVHMRTSHAHSLPHSVTFAFVCALDKSMTAFIARPPRFLCGVCTWQSLEQ